MKVNKLIKELKKIRNEYGNVEVYVFAYNYNTEQESLEPVELIQQGIDNEIVIDWR